MKYLLFLALIFSTFEKPMACDGSKLGFKLYPDNTFPEVLIETTMGNIVIELDRNRAPITVNNFLYYIHSGLYNNTVFHRVEKDFVIQGGGYGLKFDSIKECDSIFNESGNGLKNTEGTIAMARYGDPHSATSQFYFNLTDSPSLDPNAKNWGYTVFGEVIQGMDILQAMSKVTIGYSNKLAAESVPIEPIFIKTISVN
ncbi:MAG: peptidylprolyl isomerase [Proteobacteria bacterium]|nr:peptidylprolyl isomerase [Pseudomonadota bacterium]